MRGDAGLCYDIDMDGLPSGKELSVLISAAQAVPVSRSAGGNITGIAYDSRLVRPGDLFVAIKGLVADGHAYLRQAAERGAVAAIVEYEEPSLTEALPQFKVEDSRAALAMASAAFYDFPGRHLRLVAVTGTNGKTTTAHLIQQILNAAGIATGVLGTIEYRFGANSLPAPRTTPESLDLQKILHDMREQGAAAAVMEASSHALHLRRLEGLSFETAVFTNLTPEHLDYHDDMDTYFQAKSLLFDRRLYDVSNCVINGDDPYGKRLAAMCDKAALTTFGRGADNSVKLLDYTSTETGTDIKVSILSKELECWSILQGSFNIDNMLAAIAAASAMDIAPTDIVAGLRAAGGVRGRFETIDKGQKFRVIVDYAHTPDGLEKVLGAARELTKGKLVTVFGCGGDRDKSKRPAMGAVVAALSDEYIVTSDNPRSEEPESIIGEILAGVGDSHSKGRAIPDRREAIAAALAVANPGDTVVIAGKGHETGQTFSGKTIPFDDALVASELLSR